MSTIYRESDSLESEPSPTPTTIPIQINMEEEKKDAFVKNIDEDVNNLTATTDEEDRDPESQKFDRHSIQEEGLVWKGDPTYLPNSPYPEVRSAVSIEDDPTIRLNHWRTWFLTTVFVVVFAGVNQFFFPEISIARDQLPCRTSCLLSNW